MKLGVNIDHIATLREVRQVSYPDPVQAALIAQDAGADGITVHLREDRRHIQLRDVELLMQVLQIPLNLEMAATTEMLTIAERLMPAKCCLVPEKREEITTEGGLDACAQQTALADICQRLTAKGIDVSLFIDPVVEQIDAACALAVPTIELHTGSYANAKTLKQKQVHLAQLHRATEYASAKGLVVNAGHGLHYHNVQEIVALPNINELNIGHSIVARAALYGLQEAVSEMKQLLIT